MFVRITSNLARTWITFPFRMAARVQSSAGALIIRGWSFDHPWESVRSVVLDNLSRLARRQKSERSGAEGLIAGRITLGFRPSWSTPLRSSPPGGEKSVFGLQQFSSPEM